MAQPSAAPPKPPVRETHPHDGVATWTATAMVALLLALGYMTVTGRTRMPFTRVELELSGVTLWLLLMVIAVSILAGVGYRANGRWFGALIDERKRTSLSRLQIGMWTVLALSAFLAVAFVRSAPGALETPTAAEMADCRARYDDPQEKIARCPAVPEPLDVVFPAELLVALGISTASFAGSSLVRASKRAKQPVLRQDLAERKSTAEADLARARNEFDAADKKLKDALTAYLADPANQGKTQAQALAADVSLQALDAERKAARIRRDEAEETARKAAEEVAQANEKVGTLKVNESTDQATLTDMFQGNEVGNYNLIDLSKVQMFFFTVAVGVAYAASIYALLQGDLVAPFGVDLPPFSNTLNSILGISHAGYLTVQSVDHTKTTQ